MGKKKYIPPAHLDLFTPVYDLGCCLIGLGKGFRAEVVRHLKVTGTERILDAGCGTGELIVMLKGLYPRVTAEGLDPDEPALRIAGRKAIGKGLDISWQVGAMEEMPFRDETFDTIVSTLALHHVDKEHRLGALKECLRILRHGGRMVLVDIAPDDSTLSGRLLFAALGLVESLNKRDQILSLMREAGFSGVREIGKYRYGITFIEGQKVRA
jgi:ubiquinone/menaquinone biosynthesis C-methylase UbiE